MRVCAPRPAADPGFIHRREKTAPPHAPDRQVFRDYSSGRRSVNRPARCASGLTKDEVVAAVLRPGGLVVAVVLGALAAVAHGLDAGGLDAHALEVLLGGLRAVLAEREV